LIESGLAQRVNSLQQSLTLFAEKSGLILPGFAAVLNPHLLVNREHHHQLLVPDDKQSYKNQRRKTQPVAVCETLFHPAFYLAKLATINIHSLSAPCENPAQFQSFCVEARENFQDAGNHFSLCSSLPSPLVGEGPGMGLTKHFHIVRTRLLQPCAGHAHKDRLLLEFLQRMRAAVTHARL